MQCVLALLALCTGMAHSFSWDIVLLSTENGIQFYDNGKKAHLENFSVSCNEHISDITYDSVHNRVLFAIIQFNGNSAVYSFEIATKKLQYLFRTAEHRQILGFTYDHITDTIFWRQNWGDIYSYSLKPESNNEVNGTFLTEVDSATMRKIAVDNCRGYVYWIHEFTRIMRTRFNDSETQVVIDTDGNIDILVDDLTIDQLTQKIYWINSHPFSVKCSDLDGNNIRTLYETKTKTYQFTVLAVSKHFIYWGGSNYRSQGNNSFWQLQKNPPQGTDVKPIEISTTAYGHIAIVANFNTKDQTQIIDNCEALKSLLSNNSDHDPVNDSAAAGLLCVHGTKVSGKSQCECTQGYTGDRCEVSVCHDYCLQGDCSVSDGHPICRCNEGYSGERCEVNVSEAGEGGGGA